MTLDKVVVRADSIEFHEVTTRGSNFTDVNTSFNAVANFLNLPLNFTIFNVNTSTTLFTSGIGAQDFNASWTFGQVLTIGFFEEEITPGDKLCTSLTGGYVAFFTGAPAVFSLLLVLMIILVVGLMFVALKDPGSIKNIDFVQTKAFFIGMLVLAVIAMVSIVVLSTLCGLV